MGFSLSGGLSSMGKAISNTAGDMIVSEQRAQLDRERLSLAEELAEGRETRRDTRQSVINAATAEKDRTFRSGESLLNREHDIKRDLANEEGQNARNAATNSRMAASDDRADARFEREQTIRKDEIRRAERTKEEDRILEGARERTMVSVEVPYTTASGASATRSVRVQDPEKAKIVAGELRDTGHGNLASSLYIKPVVKAKAAPVTGRVKPPLSSVSSKYHTPDAASDGGD